MACEEQSGPCILGLLSKNVWGHSCTVTPPNNLPLSAADQSFDNSLDFGPLIAVTTIASAEFKRAGALSALSVFSLAEPKVIQAHACGRISVDPRVLLSQ